jgi:Na+/H+ antiporter NhaC
MSAFLATIPYNLYALLTLAMILILSTTNLSYGSMQKYEQRAEQGDIGAIQNNASINLDISEKGTVYDLVIPILCLVIFCILSMIYTGGFFSGEGISFTEAFGNCNSSLSLVFGSFGALVVCLIMFVPRKLMSFNEFFGGITEGAKNMVMPNMILALAWTISSICRDLLSTGQFVGDMVEISHFPLAFFPLVIFMVSAALSFATGTSWGTFGILIPIVIIVLQPTMATDPNLMTVSLAAVLGGSVFGDHCSPISDTTIMSSTGAGCPHIDHVVTQIPYALTVAVCSAIGYIFSAIGNHSIILTLGSGFVSLLIALFLLNKFYRVEDKTVEKSK